MILIEMELGTTAGIEGSVMINMATVSEVEELGDSVRLHMISGNSYVVTGESFGAALTGIEGIKYLKIDRNPKPVEEAEEVKEVEGELVE